MPKTLIVREGFPFVFGALFVTFIMAYFLPSYWAWFATIPFMWACFFLFFFRNPKRNINMDPSVLVSPADGTVMEVTEEFEPLFLNTQCKKVTIFLSAFNVHVNRTPIEGKITFRQYTCGGFLPAYKDSVGYENERHSIGLDNGKTQLLITQIAGIMARRIVSWTDLGQELKKGDVYGMIKFGSCTELFVPLDVEICVKKGETVRGGETIIGRLSNE